MGDFISLSKMKATKNELVHNQNTAFHLGNRAAVFIWRIFISPRSRQASLLVNAILTFIERLLGDEIIGRKGDINLTILKLLSYSLSVSIKMQSYLDHKILKPLCTKLSILSNTT